MRKLPIALFLLFPFTIKAQDINGPKEILKIMNDSKLTYQNKITDKQYNAGHRDPLVPYDLYRVEEDEKYVIRAYDSTGAADSLFRLGQKSFHQRNYDQAITYYKQAYDSDNVRTDVVTFIGECYERKGDNNEAVKWYKKSIEQNYIDYRAHWDLANQFKLQGDNESALNEILVAHFFDRNNPDIIRDLESICALNKKSYSNWSLNPQVNIEQISDDEILVESNEQWAPFAWAEAVWMYEPGYAAGKNADDSLSLEMDKWKECTLGLYASVLNDKKMQKMPEYKSLTEAADNKMFDAYWLYEVMWVGDPVSALKVGDDGLKYVAQYILDYRK